MKQTQTKVSPIIATKQLSEDAGAFWFECHPVNGMESRNDARDHTVQPRGEG